VRVALFGGSFDPPHMGHVALATAAADAFALDTVFVAPVGRQPLKPGVHSESFANRLAMVALACAPDSRLIPSDLDAPRPDGQPNFTVDTLRTIRLHAPEAELFAMIGADTYLGMSHWREPSQLFELAQWIVVTRPGFVLAPQAIAPEGRVHWLETVHVDVSATEIRRRLHQGLDCTGLIPAPVLGYIDAHGLYR
jgi:nicotinate-nucleotide adenylyltransferase